jgi:Tfp pilus assembly protein PilF
MDRVEQIIEMLKKSPGDDFLQHALALEYVKKGEDHTARSIFEEVLGRNPGYVASYYHLAGLLSRNGETEPALRWYEKGMEAAKAAGEARAYNELRASYEALKDD